MSYSFEKSVMDIQVSIDLEPFGIDDILNSSVLTEDLEIDRFDDISQDDEDMYGTSAIFANTTIDSFLVDNNFGVNETLVIDADFPAEVADPDSIPTYEIDEYIPYYKIDDTFISDIIIAAESTDDEIFPYGIGKTSVAEIVPFTGLPADEIIPIYNYDTKTKTLTLNQNITLETLPADDEIIVKTCMEDAEVIPVPSNQYYCTECDKNFYKSGPFIQHRNAQHTNDSKFRCDVCGKRYPSEKALDKHVKNHDAASKSFKCELCPKAYIYKVDLKRHLMTHEPQSNKPYQCDTCHKGFIRKDHFNNHKRSQFCKRKLQKFNLNLVKKE